MKPANKKRREVSVEDYIFDLQHQILMLERQLQMARGALNDDKRARIVNGVTRQLNEMPIGKRLRYVTVTFNRAFFSGEPDALLRSAIATALEKMFEGNNAVNHSLWREYVK